MRKVHGEKLFCADLETLTDKSAYYKATGGTLMYACCIAPIPVMFDTKDDGHSPVYDEKHGGSRYQLRLFGTFDDVMNYLNQPKEGGTNLVVYFHNGQKFDFYFIKSGLESNPATYHYDYQVDSMKESDRCLVHEGFNFWTWEKTSGGIDFTIGLGNQAEEKHIRIRFLDSRKYNTNSIKKWGKDFLGEHGTFSEDLKNDPGAQGSLKKYHFTDFTKQDLDFEYVTDINGTTALCKDGTSYDLRNANLGPQQVRDRVGMDVLIMVYVIKYLFINHLITIPHCNKIFPTLSSWSVASFVNHRLGDKNFRELVSKHGKVDNELLWKSVYGCDLTERINERSTFLNGCHGGLTTYHSKAYNTLLTGYYLSLDVNSEYPFVATRDLPYGEAHQLKAIKKNAICFVEIKFVAVKQLLPNTAPTIPCGWEDGYQSEPDQPHYCYEIDKPGHAYLITHADYEEYMNPKWYKWLGLEIVNVGGFETRPGLRDFMVVNNQQKINAKSPSERLAAKTKSNTFTGKLFQNSLRDLFITPTALVQQGITLEQVLTKFTSNEMIAPLNQFTLTGGDFALQTNHQLKLLEYQPAEFSFPCAYAYITASGRAGLINHMMTLCDAFPCVLDVYNDTDSIKLLVPNSDAYTQILAGLEDNHGLDDKELGKFKEEDKGVVCGMKVLAAKKYISTDKDGYIIKDKSGRSGFQWEDIEKKFGTDHLTPDMINPGDEFETRRSKIVKGGVIIKNVLIKLSEMNVGEENE